MSKNRRGCACLMRLVCGVCGGVIGWSWMSGSVSGTSMTLSGCSSEEGDARLSAGLTRVTLTRLLGLSGKDCEGNAKTCGEVEALPSGVSSSHGRPGLFQIGGAGVGAGVSALSGADLLICWCAARRWPHACPLSKRKAHKCVNLHVLLAQLPLLNLGHSRLFASKRQALPTV